MATDIQKLKPKSATEIAEMKPKDQVKYLLDQNKGAIAAAMPRHMNPERLMRVAQTAVSTTPALLECYVPTLLGGIIQCSQMGLEPNTVLGHAYLIPFFNSKKNRKDVQVIIGYKGLIDLARRSGQIVSIAAHAVRKGDRFVYEYGLEEKLSHTPAEGERGDITHFYAVAHMKDGGHAFEVLTKGQVEKIRDGSNGKKNAVWGQHFEEMGRKTAIRRLAKYLPLSVEFQEGVASDGQVAAELDTDGALNAEFTTIDDDNDNDGGGNALKGNATKTDDSSPERSANDRGSEGNGNAGSGGFPGAGAAGVGGSEGPGDQKGNAPPVRPVAEVVASLRAAKTVADLDDIVALFDGPLYSESERQQVNQAYHNRAELLNAAPAAPKRTRGAME